MLVHACKIVTSLIIMVISLKTQIFSEPSRFTSNFPIHVFDENSVSIVAIPFKSFNSKILHQINNLHSTNGITITKIICK